MHLKRPRRPTIRERARWASSEVYPRPALEVPYRTDAGRYAAQAHSELGGDYFERVDREAILSRSVRRIEKLGYQVTLHEASAA